MVAESSTGCDIEDAFHRPVQPKSAGTFQKLLAFLLVNLGGFCGLSLASAYYGEGNAEGLFLYDGSTYYFYWKVRTHCAQPKAVL